jgi:hypothetical protein
MLLLPVVLLGPAATQGDDGPITALAPVGVYASGLTSG